MAAQAGLNEGAEIWIVSLWGSELLGRREVIFRKFINLKVGILYGLEFNCLIYNDKYMYAKSFGHSNLFCCIYCMF